MRAVILPLAVLFLASYIPGSEAKNCTCSCRCNPQFHFMSPALHDSLMGPDGPLLIDDGDDFMCMGWAKIGMNGLKFCYNNPIHDMYITAENGCTNAHCEQKCKPLPDGAHYCECIYGYRLGDDGYSCPDIDECEEKTSGCEVGCQNDAPGYHCTCPTGYILAEDEHHCVDLNECYEHNGGCDQYCINSEGSHHCACDPGYNLVEDYYCEDINECEDGNNGGCEQTCTNTGGSFTCGCNPGYERDYTNQFSCMDINECADGIDNCDQTCENSDGSFSCSCFPGYSGSVTCTDIDECAGIHGCQQTCVNDPGSFHCTCSAGYTVDGLNCNDIDECATGANGCAHGCTNSVGSFTCTCNGGFILNGDGINCDDFCVAPFGYISGKCLWISDNLPGNQLNWQQARDACQALSAAHPTDLATIISQTQWLLIVAEINRTPPVHLWVGARWFNNAARWAEDDSIVNPNLGSFYTRTVTSGSKRGCARMLYDQSTNEMKAKNCENSNTNTNNFAYLCQIFPPA